MKYIVTTPSVETTVFKLILLMCRGYELLMFFSSIFFLLLLCVFGHIVKEAVLLNCLSWLVGLGEKDFIGNVILF